MEKIMVRYLHNFDRDYAYGGNTFAMEVVDGKLFVGVAHCSIKDSFNKEIGRLIASSYLDEIKLHHKNNDGVECITIGENDKHYKITGFVVNDEHFMDILFSFAHFDVCPYYESGTSIFNNIKISVESIDYMRMRGDDLKNILCEYYNILISSIFPDVDCKENILIPAF